MFVHQASRPLARRLASVVQLTNSDKICTLKNGCFIGTFSKRGVCCCSRCVDNKLTSGKHSSHTAPMAVIFTSLVSRRQWLAYWKHVTWRRPSIAEVEIAAFSISVIEMAQFCQQHTKRLYRLSAHIMLRSCRA